MIDQEGLPPAEYTIAPRVLRARGVILKHSKSAGQAAVAELRGKARARLRHIGNQWIASRRSLALVVPSVVLPRSSNILVNPLHPAFDQLQIGRAESCDFDPRLRGVT